jgi:predicted DsbA family dithiol-disulfide isomerase
LAGVGERPSSVEFFFDPMCPWAYQTSLWIREIRARTGLDIRWRFFSLEEINRPDDRPHPWERSWAYGYSQMRVGALLRRRGQDAVDDWYAAVGHAFHMEGRKTHEIDVHRALLDELGVGAGVVDEALADPTTGDEVRADHDWAVGEKGAFGVPTLVFPEGDALFGPVVAPALEGDAAERLWDLTLGWREFPHLYEIKRPKSDDDLRHIAGVFKPYLGARAWPTIEKSAR